MRTIETISLISQFQLFMLSMVLFTSKRGNARSNKILASFILLNALLLSQWFLNSTHWHSNIPYATGLYLTLAPLLFFYVKSLVNKEFIISGRFFLHFMPAALILLYSTVLQLLLADNHAITFGFREKIETPVLQIFLGVQVLFYAVKIYLGISLHRQNIRSHYSATGRVNLTWLLFILLAFVLMWFTDFINWLIGELGWMSTQGSQALTLTSILINFTFANILVYLGLKQPEILYGFKEPEKYAGSKLSASEQSILAEKINRMMETDNPWLNPDLTIADLASMLEIHPKMLSQVINSIFKLNFFDFVNHYRIEEARRMMVREPKMTILEILYKVGYNSKSAFNESFKKLTGMTPSRWRNQM